MDGLAAIGQMRRMPQLEQVPAIAISASVSEEDRTQILQMGFDGFVPKPVRWSHLAALLQKHLNLTFQYAAEKERAEEKAFDPRSLIPPPLEELTVLQELALMGDMKAIVSRADHFESLGDQYRPFARRLSHLAEAFEDRQIRALVQRYLDESR